MTFQFTNLCVEVTRRCNMRCPHCLRGEAEDVDIDGAYMRKLLERTNAIETVTFTGGEPSLAVGKMREFRKLCQEFHVPVYGFYVVTNGKEVTMEFLQEMMAWYVYAITCGADPESCGLALSKDNFHEKIPYQNECLLRSMAFFREDKFTNFANVELLDLGRSRDIVSYRKRDPYRYGVSTEVVDDHILYENTVTLTVEGSLLSDCDYEYDTMDDLVFGHVNNLSALLEGGEEK